MPVPKLEVVIEGLALWIDRGTYWDVLFPVCREDKKRQHHPMLSVSIAGWEIVAPTKLEGHTLDLIHLVPGIASKVRADWMLPIKPDLQNPELKPLPNSASDDVIASIRLPKRAIAPVSRTLIGPVDFDGKADRYLDFGTLWQAEIFTGQALLVLRNRMTQHATNTVPIDGFGTTITVTIRNRTEEEHEGRTDPSKSGPIKEAKDLLDLASSTQDIPVYDADNQDSKSLRAASASPSWADPFRLCPQGYCEDCPDD